MAIISTERIDTDNTPGLSQSFAGASSFTVPAGTKQMLVFLQKGYVGDIASVFTGGTWDGVTMTLVGATPANIYASIGLLLLVDPALGNRTFVVTGSTNFGRCTCVAVYLDAYGTVANYATALFAATVNVTSETGATVIAVAGNNSGTAGSVAAGTGETEVAEYAGVAIPGRYAVLTEPGAAIVTISPTLTGMSGDDIVHAVSVSAGTGQIFYLKNAVAGSSNHGSLQDGGTAPTTATTTTGWDFSGLDAGNFALMDFGLERTSGSFSGTTPSTAPDNSFGDCFRSESPYTGSFASGTWTLTVPMVADSGAGGDLLILARLWKSANPGGSGATEITSGWVSGTAVTNLQTGTPQSSVVTISGIGAVTMTNEYLFVQVCAGVQ
jgi:hypothetical protein